MAQIVNKQSKTPEQLADETIALFHHLKSSIRAQLIGLSHADESFLMPLKALDFGLGYHTGVRKDKYTPEYMHQIQIVGHIMTYIHTLERPAATITAGFLHDVSEDYGVSREELTSEFDAEVSDAVMILSKEFRGVKIDPEEYLELWSNNVIASVAKPVDRFNNLMTMNGVFKLEKQIIQCEETRKYFFRGIKNARRRFPKQNAIYENLKLMLESQLILYESGNHKGNAL